jgi:hypothetical protein
MSDYDDPPQLPDHVTLCKRVAYLMMVVEDQGSLIDKLERRLDRIDSQDLEQRLTHTRTEPTGPTHHQPCTSSRQNVLTGETHPTTVSRRPRPGHIGVERLDTSRPHRRGRHH